MVKENKIYFPAEIFHIFLLVPQRLRIDQTCRDMLRAIFDNYEIYVVLDQSKKMTYHGILYHT